MVSGKEVGDDGVGGKMPAHGRSRTARAAYLGSREELMSLALFRIEPSQLHSMRVDGVDVEARLGELIDLLADAAKQGRGMDIAAGWHLLFRDWARQGVGPRTCSYLLFVVRDTLRQRFSSAGESARAIDKRQELFLDLMRAAYEEAMSSYEESLEDCMNSLEEVEQFPIDIAAMVDSSTLARSAVSHFFDLTRARCIVLAEVDQLGRLTMIAGTPAGRALMRDFAPCLPEDCLQPVLRDGIVAWSTLDRLDPGHEDALAAKNELLILPLRVRGKTTDVALLAENLSGPRFSELTVRLARHFASRVGVALENARLHEMEQRKIDEALGLLELARVASSTLDERRMLSQAAGMLADLCQVPACAIWLKDGENGSYYLKAMNGSSLDTPGIAVAESDVPGIEKLWRGEDVLLQPLEATVFGEIVSTRESEIAKVAIYPLAVRDSRLGFILFYCDGEMDPRGLRPLMETAAGQVAMALQNAALYQDIEKSYFCTVKALAKAIEVKDPYTHGHSERVTRFAIALGERLRLSEAELQNLKYGATLHDIGKIGIAGRVLNKDSSLEPHEYEHVKTHALLGDSIIANVEFLRGTRLIIRHHHERWDGAGYPDGLQGEEIPLEARILAVADAFEAMLSRRPYRMPRSLIDARWELENNAGTQFDPHLVKVFLELIDDNPSLLRKVNRS